MTTDKKLVHEPSEESKTALFSAGKKTGFLSEATSERLSKIADSEFEPEEEMKSYSLVTMPSPVLRPGAVQYEKAKIELDMVEDQAHRTALEAKRRLKRYTQFWRLMWVLVILTVILVFVIIAWGIATSQDFWAMIVGASAPGSTGLLGLLLKLLGIARKVEDEDAQLNYIDQLEEVVRQNLGDCDSFKSPNQRIKCRTREMQKYQKQLLNMKTRRPAKRTGTKQEVSKG